ncbi:hypothetical protein D4764_13G0007070 [Takifugu flavidus]|uniref:Uncharacterized protein n=1 Tax=Takifugu flavidus TaxID=433684 RepID=A0A5C6P9E1_9TELE|nr:hypothetical protein D4764_13G0007070 [Takifugu flavidus]
MGATVFLPHLLTQQLKQRLHQSLQRATLCSQAAEEADRSRGEVEKGRALAEARALGCQRDKEVAEADRSRTREEVTQLKKELTDVQLSLAQTQKSYFETKLALERVAAENQALLQEKEKLQREREELGKQLRRTTEEKQQVEDRWTQHQSPALQQGILHKTQHFQILSLLSATKLLNLSSSPFMVSGGTFRQQKKAQEALNTKESKRKRNIRWSLVC